MSVEIRASGETVTAYLSGELDHHTARAMREAIDNAVELNMPSRLVLNFKNISFMDSSGIGLVMGRYRTLSKTGAELVISANESFARACISAFAAQLDPTLEEVNDIKTAVSEAVTNCIVHAYREKIGKIYITGELLEGNIIRIKIRDTGCGIENVEKAMEPLYTTVGGERAGLGFAVMQSFMDSVKVRSKVGNGTTIVMQKKISRRYGINA